MIKILEKKVMRGANIYSYRPVIVMTIDLGEYDEVPTSQLDGFVDKLLELLPSLEDHRCSEGVRGGLIMRMQEGTLLGHVIEHIALELQYIAYMDVGYGKTVDADAPGTFHVIFSYWVEEAGIYAGEEAVAIVNSLLTGEADEPYDLQNTIWDLKDIRDDHYLGPSTASIVREAELQGITVLRLDDYNLVQLGEGKYQKRIQAAMTSNTSLIGVETAGNKRLTKMMLEDAGLPVPKGSVVRKLSSAIEDAEWLGYPVVIKPHDGHHGKGVTTNISNEEELVAAFERAKEESDRVIIENYLSGSDYRMLVIGGKFVAAAKRLPAKITGDGEHTIDELIAIENQNPDRGYGHENVMTRLQVSSVTEHLLATAGYTMETVLPDEEDFFLELTANLSTGGSAEDVTDRVHKSNRFMAERIAKIIGLDIAGVDVMTPTLTKPIDKVGGAVIEVNAAPGLRMHLAPAKGKARNVARDIVDMLFPRGATHDIPIVVVFPLVPVTATMGMSWVAPLGKSMSTISRATLRARPLAGARCMRSPGAAFTSMTAPPTLSIGLDRVVVITSTPAMSSPTIWAIRSAMKRFDLCTRSVTSSADPPVGRLAVSSRKKSSPSGSTVSMVQPALASRCSVTDDT